MKKIVVCLLLAFSIPLAVVANPVPGDSGPGGEGGFRKHHAHKMEMMAKELGLTAEQKSKVGAIFEEQKAKFQAIHEETKTRLKTVLTPEQAKKFEDMHPPRHMMPPPPPESAPPAPAPEKPE
jgi:Spy/CpxP family protein refolding chaperone